MKNFAYLRVDDARAALDAARAAGTQYIAGGTELLNWMRLGIVEPEGLVDIGPLHGKAEIRRDGNDLVIGALANGMGALVWSLDADFARLEKMKLVELYDPPDRVSL